jgi:uncharacterized protein (TIGR02246 family)
MTLFRQLKPNYLDCDTSLTQSGERTAHHAQQELRAEIRRWLTAIGSGSADAVIRLYAKDAILLPTLSSKVLDTPEKLKSYFDQFTGLAGLKGNVDREYIRFFGDTATASGIYAFSFLDTDGATEQMKARFSFVYRLTVEGWLIVEHHSSVMPSASGILRMPANSQSTLQIKEKTPLKQGKPMNKFF